VLVAEVCHRCNSRQDLLRKASGMGWSISRTRRGHLQFRKRGRPLVFAAGTPSCPRAWQNAFATLRRFDRLAGG
jgi:hypothetical protein